jgi:hypothetical protein
VSKQSSSSFGYCWVNIQWATLQAGKGQAEELANILRMAKEKTQGASLFDNTAGPLDLILKSLHLWSNRISNLSYICFIFSFIKNVCW